MPSMDIFDPPAVGPFRRFRFANGEGVTENYAAAFKWFRIDRRVKGIPRGNN